jgi:hypothetical protein
VRRRKVDLLARELSIERIALGALIGACALWGGLVVYLLVFG